MRTAKTLIRLGGCPGRSESSLGAHSLCWFCHVVAPIVYQRESLKFASSHSFSHNARTDKSQIKYSDRVSKKILFPKCFVFLLSVSDTVPTGAAVITRLLIAFHCLVNLRLCMI